MSTPEIGKELDVGNWVITHWLNKFNIVIRTNSESTKLQMKKKYKDIKYRDEIWLRNQYINLKKSVLDIEREFGIHKNTIHKWIHILKIPVRSKSEISKLTWSKIHKNYLKDLDDKLYAKEQIVDETSTEIWVDLDNHIKEYFSNYLKNHNYITLEGITGDYMIDNIILDTNNENIYNNIKNLFRVLIEEYVETDVLSLKKNSRIFYKINGVA